MFFALPRKKDKTFYVLEGRIEMELDDSGLIYSFYRGQSTRIKPGCKHRFWSVTDTAKILEVSTHHEDSDSIRIEVSRKR